MKYVISLNKEKRYLTATDIKIKNVNLSIITTSNINRAYWFPTYKEANNGIECLIKNLDDRITNFDNFILPVSKNRESQWSKSQWSKYVLKKLNSLRNNVYNIVPINNTYMFKTHKKSGLYTLKYKIVLDNNKCTCTTCGLHINNTQYVGIGKNFDVKVCIFCLNQILKNIDFNSIKNEINDYESAKFVSMV